MLRATLKKIRHALQYQDYQNLATFFNPNATVSINGQELDDTELFDKMKKIIISFYVQILNSCVPKICV